MARAYGGMALMSGGSRRDERFVERDLAFVRRSVVDGSFREMFAGDAKHDSYMHYRYGYQPGAHHPVVGAPPTMDSSEHGDLLRQIAELKSQVKQRDTIIEDLRRQGRSGNGLPAEFDFGRRVFQCEIGHPGVGYRNTPQFGDKNRDGTGPVSPQVIIADAICQGPSAIFVREATQPNGAAGRGWLPLTDPQGKRTCFAHKGRESDLIASGEMKNFELASGAAKTPKPQDLWFSPR